MIEHESDGTRLLALMRESLKRAVVDFEKTTGKSLYEYAAPELAKRLRRAQRSQGDGSQRGVFWTWWPYCFSPLGGRLYLPLNRGYKPLGVEWDKYPVRYEDYASHGWLFTRDLGEIEDAWPSKGGGKYWLYRDGEIRDGEDLAKYAFRLARVVEATGDNALRYFTSLTGTLRVDHRPRRMGFQGLASKR